MQHTRLALVFALSIACSSARAPAPNAAPAPPVAPVDVPSVDASAPTPGPSASDEARAVIDRWLRAQNEGDHTAYGALFAERFEGVRRSGPRTRRFDRAGWLTDRQRMFLARQEVTVRDLVVAVTGRTAVARFTQEYRSGDYHDVGPKQLVLVHEADAWRIAREEMITSTLPSGGNSDVVAPGELMPLVTHDRVTYAVIDATPEGVDGVGAPVVIDRGEVMAARRAVNVAALPEAQRALEGSSVQLFGPAGVRCTATLRDVGLMRRVDVHFGTTQEWAGENGATPATPARIAEELWSLGADASLLVARIDAPQGDCTGAVWSRRASAAAPTVYAMSEASAVERTAALGAFRAMPAWRTIQQSYRDERNAPATARWDENDRARPTVQRWTSGSRRFVTVTASVAVGGCAEFSGQLGAVFELDARGRATLRSDGESPLQFVPAAAVDLDGDGTPEWITADGIVATRDGHLGIVLSVRHTALDCDC